MSVETNRDLYMAVIAELGKQQSSARSLSVYLVALRGELLGHRHAEGLSPDEFVAAIAAAFVVELEPVDTDVWRGDDLRIDEDEGPMTFASVDRILRSQVLDLEDARVSGVDRDEYRYFGMDVARRGRDQRATGSYWFNWDPAGYVECGLVGAFGGWEPGDPGDRELVPGQVAVVGPDGEITGVPPKAIESPPMALVELTWSDVGQFLWAGQTYE